MSNRIKVKKTHKLKRNLEHTRTDLGTCTYLYIYSQVRVPRSVLVCSRYVHIPRYVHKPQNYINGNVPTYLLALHVHGPRFTTFALKFSTTWLLNTDIQMLMKASFWGLFRTNFCDHFRKLFLFTKFQFPKFRGKVFLNYT